MNIDDRSQQGRDLLVGAVISIAIHCGLLAIGLLALYLDAELAEDDMDEESMEVVLDKEEPWQSDLDEQTELRDPAVEDEQDQREDNAPEIEEEQDDEQKQEPLQVEEEVVEETPEESEPEDTPLDRYAVDQVTDGEEPDEADHISDEAHRTDEEIVAEVTTMEDVEPHNEPEALEHEAETDLEMAMQTPEELEGPDIVDPDVLEEVQHLEEDFEEGDISEDDEELQDETELPGEEQEEIEPKEIYSDPNQIFVRDTDEADTAETEQDAPPESRNDLERLFGQDMERARQALGDDGGDVSESAKQQEGGGRRLLANWKENEEAMRASLENFIPHVQPGNHTSVNARASAHASYIARMHRSIHARWAESFIPRLSNNFSSRHPLNDMNLKTVVEIVIDAESGEVQETVRIQPSGNELYDAEALNTARNIGTHLNAPDEIISPDGKIYIHWTFWRDMRQCGTFGVRIYRLQDDGEQRAIEDRPGSPGDLDSEQSER